MNVFRKVQFVKKQLLILMIRSFERLLILYWEIERFQIVA